LQKTSVVGNGEREDRVGGIKLGLENPLDAKLPDPHAALLKAREGDYTSATAIHYALIKEVKTHSGKDNVSVQPNQRIAIPAQIKAALGCS
jgi:hypothetical protein